MNILIEKLRNIVTERRQDGISDDVILNALKEELHYAVLDFIYNSRTYSHLVMYGGTLLRIVYGLSRMSEDLDFQTDKKFDFEKFGKDIKKYFKSDYDIDISVRYKTERQTGTDYAFINFPDILGEVGIKGHGVFDVLKIRFDVNFFEKTSEFSVETIPVTSGTYAFSIKTYSLSTLMASKIAAVLLRTKRGIGKEMAPCKPRDIFDLDWYMSKKVIPNIEYLKAIHDRGGKSIVIRNVLDVFDMLRERVPNLDDALFKNDLWRFFYNSVEYDDWHSNWRQRFIQLINSYEIHKVKTLTAVWLAKEFSTANRHFQYVFSTEKSGVNVIFRCTLSEYWYVWPDFRIVGHRRKDLVINIPDLTDLDYEYFGLFYTKIEDYLKRNDYVVLQPEFKTKIIRADADNLNIKTQLFLDRRLLEIARFEDLL